MKGYVIESDKVAVELGEKRDTIIKRLSESQVRYVVTFDGLEKSSNIKETIINIPDYGVEVMLEDDIVCYIKSHNNTYNIICRTNIGKTMTLQDIDNIISSIADRFGISPKDIDIRSFNLKRADAVVYIKYDDKYEVKAHLLCNLSGEVYISTLKLIASGIK